MESPTAALPGRRALAVALLAAASMLTPRAHADGPAPEDVDPALDGPIAALLAGSGGAVDSVALLPVRIAGGPLHAIARPWVVDTDALETGLRRALGGDGRAVVAVRERPDAPHLADLRALHRLTVDPEPAARLGRAFGTDVVVAARVRIADGAPFLDRAPALEVELRLWPAAADGAIRPAAVRSPVVAGDAHFFTWNPVLLASFGVGMLALRGRPAGRDVARAARLRATRGVAAAGREVGDVDLPIALG